MKRRRFIQYAGFGGVGLWIASSQQGLALTNLAVQKNATFSFSDNYFHNLESFSYESIQLNPKGQAIAHQTHQARFLTLELGDGIGLDLVAIHPGKFWMGASQAEKFASSQESPQHPVNINKPFLIGKFPVTQAQWQAVAMLPKINRDLVAQPAYFKGAKRPVESVSWLDAIEFCDRLSALTRKPYRLPSEAEWEYACRGGTTTPFGHGNTITSQVANYVSQYAYAAEATGDYPQATTPVDQFLPNAVGLHDMHGNVWEWCADHWHDTYIGAPPGNQPWLKGGNSAWRSLRGGSWSDYPSRLRSAYRTGYPAESLNRTIGFRICSTVV